jgi:3-hexulose-6-phosphate synthase/6-phospho-3-hexuloisomerase
LPEENGITFQLSLDQTNTDEAVELGKIGAIAGVQVLEAGTPLIMAEGARTIIPRLHTLFPNHPIVADIKCMDGGAHEVGLMFELGASKATVMASASDATIVRTIRESANHQDCAIMVDTMGFGGRDGRDIQGQVDAAKRARDLGGHYIVLHLGYDERGENQQMIDDNLLLRWAEAVANEDLGIPIQVVGGLTLAQAKELPKFGINEIVISMNLGSQPMGDLQYDKITAFTLNLHDPGDREKVVAQIQQFMADVLAES